MKPCAYLKKQKLSPNISGQWLLTEWTQQIFTCSTSAKETSKYEINLKSTVKTLQKCQWRINDIVLVSLLLIFNIFYTVSIADFEQVNTWWEIKFNKLFRLQSGLIIMSDKKAWGSEFCLILCGVIDRNLQAKWFHTSLHCLGKCYESLKFLETKRKLLVGNMK